MEEKRKNTGARTLGGRRGEVEFKLRVEKIKGLKWRF